MQTERRDTGPRGSTRCLKGYLLSFVNQILRAARRTEKLGKLAAFVRGADIVSIKQIPRAPERRRERKRERERDRGRRKRKRSVKGCYQAGREPGQRECKRTRREGEEENQARPEHIPEQRVAESLKYASTYRSEGYSNGTNPPARIHTKSTIARASYFLIQGEFNSAARVASGFAFQPGRKLRAYPDIRVW